MLPGACGKSGPADHAPDFLVYVSEASGNADVFSIPPGSDRPHKLLAGPSAEFPAAAASDGSVAVVAAHDSGGVHFEEILLVRPGSHSAARRLLQQPAGRARNPQFSPDAKFIYFEADYAGFRDIYRVSTRSGAIRRLTRTPAGSFEPAVSPDGRRLAYVSSSEGNAEIYTMSNDGSEQQRLTAFHRDDVSPRWSADGQRLAFISNREGDDRVFVMSPDGTGQERIGISDGGIEAETDATWSPTASSELVFSRRKEGRWRLVLYNVTRKTERELTPQTVDARFPAYSTDGQWIAYTATKNGNADIVMIRTDGGGRRIVAAGPEPQWLPLWATRPPN